MPGVHIGDERGEHRPGPGRHVGQVDHPQLDGALGGEVAIDQARGPLGLALRLLRDRGLVTVRPGPAGGVFVAASPAQVRLGAIDVWFSGAVGDPRELFASRVFFDDAFAVLAVERAEPEDVRAMAWALDEMRAARDDPRGYLDASMRFHLAIARASRLPVVVGLYETVVALLRTGMARAQFVEPRQDRVAHSLEVHENMLTAIRDGDPTAMGKLVAVHGADLRRVDD